MDVWELLFFDCQSSHLSVHALVNPGHSRCCMDLHYKIKARGWCCYCFNPCNGYRASGVLVWSTVPSLGNNILGIGLINS